jgi:CheY-like chemotaxis protein
MTAPRPPVFELPDDMVIGGGDGDDEARRGAGSTLPQDLFPLGEPMGTPQLAVRPAAPAVKVPAHQAIIAPMLPSGRLPADGPQPKRVLVVDDDATARLYMRSKLMLRGHVQILEAINGLQALEFVMAQRFDAVLLDVDMGAQNGYEVCRAVRSHVRGEGGKQPRIYMITSRTSMLDKMRAKMAGADAFLSKPPHPGEFAKLLARL